MKFADLASRLSPDAVEAGMEAGRIEIPDAAMAGLSSELRGAARPSQQHPAAQASSVRTDEPGERQAATKGPSAAELIEDVLGQHAPDVLAEVEARGAADRRPGDEEPEVEGDSAAVADDTADDLDGEDNDLESVLAPAAPKAKTPAKPPTPWEKMAATLVEQNKAQSAQIEKLLQQLAAQAPRQEQQQQQQRIDLSDPAVRAQIMTKAGWDPENPYQQLAFDAWAAGKQAQEDARSTRDELLAQNRQILEYLQGQHQAQQFQAQAQAVEGKVSKALKRYDLPKATRAHILEQVAYGVQAGMSERDAFKAVMQPILPLLRERDPEERGERPATRRPPPEQRAERRRQLRAVGARGSTGGKTRGIDFDNASPEEIEGALFRQ